MDIILDIIIDTIKIVPFIVITYIFLDLYEKNSDINNKLNMLFSTKWGPILGALIACIPQCGFSFMAATLFIYHLITPGTLVAVFIATSDEALPILISSPSAYKSLFALIVLKIVLGIIAGYLLDGILSLFKYKLTSPDDNDEEIIISDPTCVCGTSTFQNVLIRSSKTIFYVLLANSFLSLIIYILGNDNLSAFLNNTLFIQPFLTALVGFIPNCAASIVITELYLLKGISFGAMLSGLCSGAGIGILVLFKDLKDKKQLWLLISYLYIFSVIVGEIVQYLI